MSDSQDRKPMDVNHVIEDLIGGADRAPPKKKARRSPKLRVLDRVHESITEEPVAWLPKNGLPAGGRDECRHGERPCPYVRCKWHLWLVLGEDRRGRRWNGELLPTTLIPGWLEYPTPACCALDVAEAMGEDPAPVKRIASVMHLCRSTVHKIVERSIRKLKAMREEKTLEALREHAGDGEE